MYFRKVGKVVSFSLYGDFRNLPVTSDWISIGNIPQGYRPNAVLLFREQTAYDFTIKMKTDGVIELFNYMDHPYTVVNGFFNGSWIVN